MARMTRSATINLPVSNFLLSINMNVTLLIPRNMFRDSIIHVRRIGAIILLGTLHKFIPFRRFFLKSTAKIIMGMVMLRITIRRFLVLRFRCNLYFRATIINFNVVNGIIYAIGNYYTCCICWENRYSSY